MFFEHSQGGWLDHFPGQPVPILDTTSCEEISLNIQSKPLWCNLRPFVVVLSPTSRGYSFPFLSPKPPFLQTEHPHLSQPLLTHHVPQTLPQLQNLFFKAKGPKFNTEFEVSKPINTTEIPQPLCTQRGIFSSWCTHSWGCSSASVHCFARHLPHLAYDHTKFLMTTHLGSEENKSAQVQIAKSPVWNRVTKSWVLLQA